MNFVLPASHVGFLQKNSGVRPKYIRDLHPGQRRFIEFKGKRRAAHPPRRGGKSRVVGAWLLEGCELKPGEKSVYIALTRGKAKSIIWDACLEPMNREYKLGLKLKHDEGMLYIVHPNGSRIWLLGVDDSSQVDKVRGEKLFRAVVDEAQAFGDYLRDLVESALLWALIDLDGEIAMTGTPDPMCVGYFWAACTGEDKNVKRWPAFHWPLSDNLSLKDPETGEPNATERLGRLKEANGWDDDHPTYQREGLGLWVKDVNALIYPLDASRNAWVPAADGGFFGLPDGDYIFGLGVDLGFSKDSTAFVLLAVPIGTGKAYVVRAYTKSKLTASTLAEHVRSLRNEVQRVTGKGLRVVVDEGALGVGYAEQMRDLGVGCEAAQKNEKRAYQEYVKGLVQAGNVLVNYRDAHSLVEECGKLQFDPETGKEDERYVRHCADSFLYITRAMLPREVPKPTGPEPGSKEAINLDMHRHKQEMARKIEKKNRQRMAA